MHSTAVLKNRNWKKKLKNVIWKHLSSKKLKLTKIRLERQGSVDLSKTFSVKQTKSKFMCFQMFVY